MSRCFGLPVFVLVDVTYCALCSASMKQADVIMMTDSDDSKNTASFCGSSVIKLNNPLTLTNSTILLP